VTDTDRERLARMANVSQRLLSEDTSLVDSLQGVAGAGCTLLGGCSASSITLIEKDRPTTVAATDDTAVALDKAQYAEGDGPCLTSAREETVISLEDATAAPRWPAFAQAASELGVGSSLSVPLSLPGDTFGGLNLYGTEVGAFDDQDQAIARTFATQASAVVWNALAYWTAHEQATNLTLAMEHRAVIEQAKGIIMAAQHCSADEAFDILRRASQRENRKLRDIASDLVERTTDGGDHS
jgi:GAF domain-containing protein